MSDGAEVTGKRDRWIPWMFVLFFAVIIAVDSVMVTIAIKTGPGTVTDHPYEEGLAYNKIIAEAAQEKALGWKSSVALKNGEMVVTLYDSSGQALDGATVSIRAERPVQDGHDFDLILNQQEAGIYTAAAPFPLPGQWNIRVFASWQDNRYQYSRTIMAP